MKIKCVPLFFFRIVIFSVFIVLFLGCSSSDNSLCIHDNSFNKDDLGLSFIPEEDCYGYVFSQSKSIVYHSYNSGKKGMIEVVLKDNHRSWLRGRMIRLTENKLAFNYRNHFSNLMSVYRKPYNESFDDYLGLVGYLKTDAISGAKTLHLFNVGEDVALPLYVSCFFQSEQSDLADVQCSVSFAYNSTVSVYVTVNYLDLKNAQSRAVEIRDLISDLII